jgi:hypothetical protein
LGLLVVLVTLSLLLQEQPCKPAGSMCMRAVPFQHKQATLRGTTHWWLACWKPQRLSMTVANQPTAAVLR